MQTKPAMEVRNLSFSYGKQKVLKDVSLKIEEGKITTILGANGCGKSDTVFSDDKKQVFQKRKYFSQWKKRFKIELEGICQESSDRAAVQHVK